MPVRFQVDPDFYDHPKTDGMSDAATALWVRAGSYSVAKLLDGFVPDTKLASLSKTPTEAARELLRRGLWSRVKGGFLFHQWEQRNLTRARVEAEREADRLRKQGKRGKEKPQVEASTVRSESEPESSENPNGVRPLSVSVSVSESVSGSGHEISVTELGPEPARACPTHRDDPEAPPCGKCKTLRIGWEQWHVRRQLLIAAMPDCPIHAGSPAHNCGLCRSELIGAA